MDDCDKIEAKLREALEIEALEVVNFSHEHAGHAGSPGSGRSHFRLNIKSRELSALSRVAAHQRLYAILADEMASHIHALEINLQK